MNTANSVFWWSESARAMVVLYRLTTKSRSAIGRVIPVRPCCSSIPPCGWAIHVSMTLTGSLELVTVNRYTFDVAVPCSSDPASTYPELEFTYLRVCDASAMPKPTLLSIPSEAALFEVE